MSNPGFVRGTDNIELLTLDQVDGSYQFLYSLYEDFQATSVDAFKHTSVLDFADQAMYFAVILLKDSAELAAQAEAKLRSSVRARYTPPPTAPLPLPPIEEPVPRAHSPIALDDVRVNQDEEEPPVAGVSSTRPGPSGNAAQTSSDGALSPSESNAALWVPPPRNKEDDPWDSSSDDDDIGEGNVMDIDAPTRTDSRTRHIDQNEAPLGEKRPITPPSTSNLPRMSPTSAEALNSKATEELARRERERRILDRDGLPLLTAVQPRNVSITTPGLDDFIPKIPALERGSHTNDHGTVHWFGSQSSTTPINTSDWGERRPTSSTRPLNIRKSPLSNPNPRPSRLRATVNTPINTWQNYIPPQRFVNEDPPPVPKNYVGFVYLTIPFTDGEANVGVMVQREYRRKGVANQAMDLVLSCAFEELKLHRVQALVVDSPTKDSAITFFIQKCFTHEGTRRRSVYSPTGVWSDVTYLSMLDTDWTMRGYVRPAPRSLWDEMFVRHQREREELLRWDERRLKRTTSLETIRGPVHGKIVHEAMYDSSAVSESGGDTESFVSFPDTVSGTKTGPSTQFGSEADDDDMLSSLPASSQGSPSMSSVSSASRQWEVLSSASGPLASDSEVSDFEMVDDD